MAIDFGSAIIKAELLKQIASKTPEEMAAALERLLGEGLISMSEAEDVYTAAMKCRRLTKARSELVEAAEAITVYYINSVGLIQTTEDPEHFEGLRGRFNDAIDNLIELASS